jgi:TRAP-type transport system periplasmic protein
MRTYNPTTVRIAELLGAKPVDVPMVQVGQALAEGRMNAMITSAVTGVENKVWGGLKHYYELNAWFPKNIVFVNARAFAALPPAVQQAVLHSAAVAEQRGFAASRAAASEATEELRRNGIKVESVPFELGRDLKRLGEKFSREWVASVGHAANEIFIPFYELDR